MCGRGAFAQEAPELSAHGFLALRGVWVESQPSWLEGGFGRLTYGALPGEDERVLALGLAQVAVDWRPYPVLGVHVLATGRAEQTESFGDPFGIEEAYLDARFRFGEAQRLRLRLGGFFLPTSRENVDEAWGSRYALTLSAINTWMAEEIWPTGLDAEYRFPAGQDRVTLAATVFGGNDAAGALLAWRGWSMGDRLTGYGEVLPLPPLGSLDGPFARQRRDGTKPFGRDLDGELGWSARARWSRRDTALVQFTHYDNRGDRHLYRGEYAWATQFDLLGIELHLAPAVIFAAEALMGTTAMGPVPPNPADVEYRAAYALVSYAPGRTRFTARWDRFDTRDRDRFAAAEDNDGDGTAWTFAALYDLDSGFRLGAELLVLEGTHDAAAQYGHDSDIGASSLLLELRWSF